MNFSSRVHFWAKATCISFLGLLVTLPILFFDVQLLAFIPVCLLLVFSLSWLRWMELAEVEQAAFEANEPDMSKEIE